MRTPEEIRVAIRHYSEALHGCEQQGDTVKAGFCSRMIDFARWVLKEPSAFHEQMKAFEEVDKRRGLTR